MCVSLLSDTSGAGSGEVAMIVFVNQMLLMIAGDVEPNPGPGKFIIAFNHYISLLSSIIQILCQQMILEQL